MTDINAFQTRIANKTNEVLLTTTISADDDTSSVIDLAGCNLVAFQMPASFTGSSISFLGSFDGSNFSDLYRTVDGALITTPVAVNRMYLLSVADFAGIQYMKIKSNATELDDRVINLLARAMA